MIVEVITGMTSADYASKALLVHAIEELADDLEAARAVDPDDPPEVEQIWQEIQGADWQMHFRDDNLPLALRYCWDNLQEGNPRNFFYLLFRWPWPEGWDRKTLQDVMSRAINKNFLTWNLPRDLNKVSERFYDSERRIYELLLEKVRLQRNDSPSDLAPIAWECIRKYDYETLNIKAPGTDANSRVRKKYSQNCADALRASVHLAYAKTRGPKLPERIRALKQFAKDLA